MTVFALQTAKDVLAVRFACSPLWETQAALQAIVDKRAHSYHESWLRLAGTSVAHLDLSPLLAVLAQRDCVPDFLTPPPRSATPQFRDQLAEIRATSPAQVALDLKRCRESMGNDRSRHALDSFLADPAGARDLLAVRLHDVWNHLVAPYWVRIRALLERDIQQRSRTFARHGLRRVLDELHPKVRWTKAGLSLADRRNCTVAIDERGLVLMPSAYVWPYVAAVADAPWLPTIVYPALGVEDLMRGPVATSDELGRLLGRTRALVLASLDRPAPTTVLAEYLELSAAGASRHLIVLRDAGLVSSARHGHKVYYERTELGSALLGAASYEASHPVSTRGARLDDRHNAQ